MRYSCRPFIGHNSDNSWTQYWEGGVDGLTFCLINISSLSADLPQVGREILDQLSSIDTPQSINQTLLNIQNNPEYSKITITLSLGMLSGSQIHVAQLNDGYIYIKRGNNLSLLIEGQSGGIKVFAGTVVDRDQILFLSPKFYANFSQDYLLKTLAAKTLASIEEAILSDLVNLDDQNVTSAALVEFQQDHEEIITTPEITPTPVIKSPLHQDIDVSHIPIRQTNRRRKIRLIIGILILILFIVSIFFSFKQNQIKSTEKKYTQLASQIQQSLEQSAKLKPLNLQNSLDEAKKAQSLLPEIKKLNVHSDKITELENQINSLLTQTGSSEYQPVFHYEASLIDNSAKFSQLRISSDKFYLLDSSGSKLYELSINDKNQRLVSDDASLQNVLDFAVDKNQVTILQDKSISVLKDGKLSGTFELKEIVPTHFHLWNGSAYFLTTDSIYKSAPNNTSFSPPQLWLKTGNLLAQNTSSIAINGSIWTLTSNGSITSYTQGIKDKTISPLSSDIKSASRLQAAPDYDKLVFTDGDSIVYVYNKAGESVSKFNYGDLEIADIALDAPSNTVFVLCTDQKIYKISL